MEERSATFRLLLKSSLIEQLQVLLCDPVESTLEAAVLLNYQESTLRTSSRHSHYYCLISIPGQEHILELPLPYEGGPSLTKEADFGTFRLRVSTSLEFLSDLGLGNQEECPFWSMSRLNYLRMKR